ncbi:MAG: trans-aconitate 2-methyltransferase [Thermoleophilaceae bacterium]|nr:trans-aconitate 2-methyltransferase [Thermoleophilaceae bacterium]
MSANTRDWDAATYERVSDHQFQWGIETLDRLELEGSERVLDAGCGSGRVTRVLRDRLPEGHVVAVDASPSMVDKAREALGAERIEYGVQDLAELRLDEPVDAILSTAVFHWIPDHDALFASLHDALKPGGRLEAQCGAEGNISNVRAALADITDDAPWDEYFGDWPGPWNFAGSHETKERLEQAGFTDVSCWLQRKTLRSDEPEAFLRSVTLGTHVERLPEELRNAFVRAVAEYLGAPLEIDYVRLNFSARRAA